MASAFRVCPRLHARTGEQAFSGTGSRLFGGRWNSKGMAVAYASTTLSLAALEYLVHADVRLLRELRLVSCEASWPDELRVEVIRVGDLPSAWRNAPPPPALAALGDAWISDGRTAVLLVPSAVVPSENNVLINPTHPDARRIDYGSPSPFTYDPRLL
jgi:RES domain-containing protein